MPVFFIPEHCCVECLGIHTTLDKLLEMLGKTVLLLESCTMAGPGQQAQPFVVPDITIAPL